MDNVFSLIIDGLIFLNFLFAIFVVFFERRNPAVIWSWLMLLSILPGIGFIIYLAFGFDGRKHTRFMQKSRNDNFLKQEYLKKIESIEENYDYYIKNSENDFYKGEPQYQDIFYLNKISGKSPLRYDNSVTIYNEGNSKFEAMLSDIKNAKTFIHLEYYIVRSDNLGRHIMKALAEKAAQGVEVKLLYDGMGNIFNSKSFNRPLIEAGGEVGIFLSPYSIRLNYRNHRKLCIIDGKIGYVGGLNIGDEYVGRVKRYGFWRDSHIRFEGKAVHDLELRFISDWNFASKNEIILNKKYFPKPELPEKGINMQILSSGPDCRWNSIQYGYFKMITEASKSVCFQTPYFIPDDSILEALKTTSLSGIDVKIIIPAHPDHPFVFAASISYISELLNSGVKCYKYEKGFIHSKFITIDDKITSIGTANMDIRSLKLNFEINAFIYDEMITKSFNESFKKDLNDCTEITQEWYDSRSKLFRIQESISRLISPLL